MFSFVDRERTAQENTTNPTEAALAQLYAHIQSLPESSKKRRLVKQFNRENGNGTPNNNRARSIGDSIKVRQFCTKLCWLTLNYYHVTYYRQMEQTLYYETKSLSFLRTQSPDQLVNWVCIIPCFRNTFSTKPWSPQEAFVSLDSWKRDLVVKRFWM